MVNEWINWSGSIKFTPELLEKPQNEEEVKNLVQRALDENKEIRIVGAGHSSVPLVQTNKILVSQENLKGLTAHDKEKYEVKMLPGTSISESGELLVKLRMNMHNTGDVDFQFLGGAFGTGTHGSGKTLRNLSAMMVGCRLVDGNAQIKEYALDKDPEMIRALRVSLGAMGFFTELTLKVEPAQEFYRYEFCTHIDTCLENLDELIERNRMFDFYWYPRSDLAKIRICNPLGEGMQELPYAKKVKEETGWLSDILPKQRELKYEEMEYALPFEPSLECFREIRHRIKEKHRQYVGWRVLVRTIAADDAYLSPFHQRDSVTIAILQNNELEYEKYFNDIEPIFKSYFGRPHWGKKHTMKAEELKPLYPKWDRFLEIRRELDPNGIFLNSYLKKIFGL